MYDIFYNAGYLLTNYIIRIYLLTSTFLCGLIPFICWLLQFVCWFLPFICWLLPFLCWLPPFVFWLLPFIYWLLPAQDLKVNKYSYSKPIFIRMLKAAMVHYLPVFLCLSRAVLINVQLTWFFLAMKVIVLAQRYLCQVRHSHLENRYLDTGRRTTGQWTHHLKMYWSCYGSVKSVLELSN